MADPTSRIKIGARLVLTRKALDYTQATMAGLMGIDGQTLGACNATEPFTAALAVVRVLPEIEPLFYGVGITSGPQRLVEVAMPRPGQLVP
jgi:hypothetical protein